MPLLIFCSNATVLNIGKYQVFAHSDVIEKHFEMLSSTAVIKCDLLLRDYNRIIGKRKGLNTEMIKTELNSYWEFEIQSIALPNCATTN